ncbi:MAG: hypothetical protein WA172_16325 [Terriglobales bacterium]
MGTLDPAGEFLRITERYRQMSDSELLVLIPQSSQLTQFAQQALASEVRSRGLRLEDEEANAQPAIPKPVVYDRHAQTFADSSVRNSSSINSSLSNSSSINSSPINSREGASSGDLDSSDNRDSSPDDSSYYEDDRELVEVCTVWSLADALQVQTLLERAGIPFYIGPKKATRVDAGTLNFGNGVSVQVMRIGLPWAAQALQNYKPADEPARKHEEELPELSVRCPKCRSTEIILGDVVPERAGASRNASPAYRWSCDSCGCEWEDDGTVKE